MAVSVGELEAILRLKDEMSGKLADAAKNVSAFEGMFDGAMGTVAAGAGIALAAITAIGVSVIALGQRGADIADVRGSLDKFTGSAQQSKEAIDAMKAASLGTVDNLTLMKSAAGLLGAGVKLTAQELGTMTGAAFELQNRGLGPTKDMLDLVGQAMITGRTRALAMKLGVAEGADAEVLYANRLGVTVDQLTDADKAAAKRIQVMGMLDAANKSGAGAQRDFGEQIEFAEAKLRDFVDQIAEAITNSPAMGKVLDAIGEAFNAAFGDMQSGAVQSVTDHLVQFAQVAGSVIVVLIEIAGKVVAFTQFLYQHRDIIKEIVIVVGSVAAAYYAVTIATEIAAAATTLLTGGMALLGVAVQVATGPVGLIVLGLVGLYELLKQTGALEPLLGFLGDLGKIIMGVVKAAFDAVWPTIKVVGEFLGMVFVGYLKLLFAPLIWLGSLLMDTLIPAFKSVATFVHALADTFGLSKEKTDAMAKSTEAAVVPTATLTDATKKSDDALKGQGKAFTETADQAKKHQEQIAANKKTADEHAAAMKTLEGYTADYRVVLGTVDGALRSQIDRYLDAGASIGDIAKAYPQLSDAQIHALDEMHKARVKATDEEKKAAEEIMKMKADNVIAEMKLHGDTLESRLRILGLEKQAEIDHSRIGIGTQQQKFDRFIEIVRDYSIKEADEQQKQALETAKIVMAGLISVEKLRRDSQQYTAGLYRTDLEAARAAIDEQVQANITAFVGTDAQRKQYSDLAKQYGKDQKDALLLDIDAIKQNSNQNLTEMAAKSQAMYEYMKTHPKEFSEATIARFKDISDKAAAHASKSGKTWEEMFGQLKGDIDKLVTDFGNLSKIMGGNFDGVIQKIGTVVASVNTVIDTVKTVRDTVHTVESAIKKWKDAADASGQGFKAAAAEAAGVAIIVGAITTIVGGYLGMLSETKRQQEEAAAAWAKWQKEGAEREKKYMEDAVALLGTYQIAWSDLGDTAREARISELTLEIARHYEMLITAGATVNAATKAMSKDVNGALIKIAESGGQINPSLMPAVERMIELGLVSEEAMRKMMGLTDNTMPKFKETEEAANRWGIALKDLGPKFQQAKLDEIFKGYSDDFALLVGNGADMDAVLDKMGPKVNEAVNQAIKFGVTIPASMRPMIEAMEKNGKLVDENGDKLTDLSKLKFAEPIEESMKKLVDLFKEFIDQIKKSSEFIAKIPREIPVEVNIKYNDPGFTPQSVNAGGSNSGGGDNGNSPGFAEGGNIQGIDHINVRLADGEGVLSRRGMAALGAMNQGRIAAPQSSSDQAAEELRKLRADINDILRSQEVSNRTMPDTIARAIRDALLLTS